MSAIPVCPRYSSALRAIYRGSRVYISPVMGSRTKQCTTRVGWARKGSMYAPSGSGTRSMSDSWISWNPRIEDPSNPYPVSKPSSLSSAMGMEKCCMSPGRSQNRRSTTCASAFLARSSTSLGVTTEPPSSRVGRRLAGPRCSMVSGRLNPCYALGGPVAHAPDGLDEVLLGRPELGPEPPDVNVDGPGPAVEVVPPHLLEQRG